MKKVLIGLGIGCGVLMLLGGIAAVAGLMWAKGKAEAVVAYGEEMEKQEKQLQSLDQKYSFKAPAEGEPLTIDEARLKDYLAVRAGVKPVFTAFETKTKEFEGRHKGRESVSGAFEAVGLISGLVKEVRTAYLTQLDTRKMGPREFTSITGAIYAAHFGKGMAEVQEGVREELNRSIEELQDEINDDSIPEEQKAGQREQLATLEAQREALGADAPMVENLEVHTANAELLAKFKVEIENEANPALDVFLLGESGAINGINMQVQQ